MEHSGELVLNRARNAKLVQSPSMAHDITWFTKTLISLCKALVYAGGHVVGHVGPEATGFLVVPPVEFIFSSCRR